ncbi:CDP-alcohol phosphatidyltransferase family protein [Natronorubrum sp. JWXQ-INN-674]|uniref:CDP-alcohol phosphatidyltransferase family protein n=1 Tax=Natronorubrum halalkaliphilum TaxID=2691917 RepID=A0A6B0VRW8_9EURY|nr:CDP-alcohol phosphatidyltransferase family protein [Natronorubrum halalkaliphilum]MXV63716.1 CDP-alcohol phosphatidyltransferase family protein [Natronorubrum halalkaliphilum]
MTDDSVLTVRRRARSRWARISAGNAAMVALAVVALESLWTDGPPPGFLVAVGVMLTLESAFVYRLLGGLERTRRPANRPVTIATWVTVARGAAVAVLAGFVGTEPPSGIAWVPAALFAAAAAFDAVDGAIARATDTVTDFGARLDVETDGLVVLVGTLVAVVDGALPRFFLAVAVARYLFVAGQWWRERQSKPVFDLPPNRLRRPLGGLAMLAVWLALLPIPGDTVSRAFATLLVVPFLANFCWDWLAVTGRVGPSARP